MSLLGRLIREYVDVIEWVDITSNTLVWKFPRNDNEIKMGAKLTVRESQMAIFMNEGKIADVYNPGMYQLTTQNMPVLSTLQGWKYGFQSPFKADVYFISTRQFTNQKWGTANPVIVRDAEFGAVRLRAYGSFSFAINDPKLFLTQISATNPDFTADDINQQLRNIALSRGMAAIASSKISVLDLTANYDGLSKMITDTIQPDFNEIGLSLKKFLVENISLPPEVEEALDKRSEMGFIGNLGSYAQFQTANAIEKSAENTSGGNLASAGFSVGIGAAVAGQMRDIFQSNPVSPSATTVTDVPPPLPVSVVYYVAVNGKQEGPFSFEQIDDMITRRTLGNKTMVWKKGMAAWAAASTVTELSDLLSVLPPPLS